MYCTIEIIIIIIARITPIAEAKPYLFNVNALSYTKYIIVDVEYAGPPEVKSCIIANVWNEFIVEIITIYNVVGIKRGHVIFVNTCHGVAPSKNRYERTLETGGENRQAGSANLMD